MTFYSTGSFPFSYPRKCFDWWAKFNPAFATVKRALYGTKHTLNLNTTLIYLDGWNMPTAQLKPPSLFLNMALNLAAIFTARPLWIDGLTLDQVLSVKSARTSMDCKHAIQRAPTFLELEERTCIFSHDTTVSEKTLIITVSALDVIMTCSGQSINWGG